MGSSTYVRIDSVVVGPEDWVGKRSASFPLGKLGGKGISRSREGITGMGGFNPDWFDQYVNEHDVRCWEVDLATGRALIFKSVREGELLRAANQFAEERTLSLIHI